MKRWYQLSMGIVGRRHRDRPNVNSSERYHDDWAKRGTTSMEAAGWKKD